MSSTHYEANALQELFSGNRKVGKREERGRRLLGDGHPTFTPKKGDAVKHLLAVSMVLCVIGVLGCGQDKGIVKIEVINGTSAEEQQPAQGEYTGDITISGSAEVAKLYSSVNGEPIAMAVMSTSMSVEGQHLPSLEDGEVYMVIESASATKWEISGKGPVLDLAFRNEVGTGWNRFYILTRAEAEAALDHLEDLFGGTNLIPDTTRPKI